MSAAHNTVRVTAPARLHLGFLDLNGDLGRRFGGLGLTLDDITTRLTLTHATTSVAEGPDATRCLEYARQVMQALRLERGVRIHIDAAIPGHAGLGSGTQLALSVSAGIATLFQRAVDLRLLSQRGVRSGIGLAAFEQGGFIVDGGRGPETSTPPMLCRLPFPEEWRIVLIFDSGCEGLNGEREGEAFKQLPPMSVADSGQICRRVLMQVLPALIERDFLQFSIGITQIQDAMGNYFAQSQGGRYSSARVAGAISWLKDRGIVGIGQSSWGPTGFALIEDAMQAEALVQRAQQYCDPTLRFKICRARNAGAEISSSNR